MGAPEPYTGPKGDVHAEVLVLGAGPGGYTAAFRAADLGKKVLWWTPRPAGRGLPQRGLHPVQGAAARRQGHRRDQGDERARRVVRRAHDRPRRAAQLEGRRRHPAHRRADGAGQAAEGHHGGRHRHGSPRRTCSRSPARTARPPSSLRPRVIAAGSEPVRAAVRAARRPARDRLDRGAGARPTSPSGCWSSAAGSSAWRWPRCTPSSARDHGRGADGPAHPRRGQGPRHPAAPSGSASATTTSSSDQGHRASRPARTGSWSRSTPREQGQGHSPRDRGVRQRAGGRRTPSHRHG